MNYTHSLPSSLAFEGKGLFGYSFGPLSQKDLEIYYIEVEKGHDTFMISRKITRVYYVLSGNGYFTISDRRYDVGAGMLVEVPLQLWALPGNPSVALVHAALADSFSGENLIEVASLSEAADKRTLDAEELKNTNRLKLYVFGNEARRQARVVAVLDNLGKGAAGACVQNLNAMMGWPETAGLV